MLGFLLTSCLLCYYLPIAFMPVLASAFSPSRYFRSIRTEEIAPKVFIIDMVSDSSLHTAIHSKTA